VKNKDMNFEDAMDRLEDIVGILQNGKLSLDESLEIFEEGISLVRQCQKKLENAEGKVTLLIKNENGEMIEKPFYPESGE
jgi:exodeoxyribonuclease VII small subunit